MLRLKQGWMTGVSSFTFTCYICSCTLSQLNCLTTYDEEPLLLDIDIKFELCYFYMYTYFNVYLHFVSACFVAFISVIGFIWMLIIDLIMCFQI